MVRVSWCSKSSYAMDLDSIVAKVAKGIRPSSSTLEARSLERRRRDLRLSHSSAHDSALAFLESRILVRSIPSPGATTHRHRGMATLGRPDRDGQEVPSNVLI